MLPIPLKTLSVFIEKKTPLAPRIKENVSAPIFFSGKKPNLASCVNISRIKAMFIFSLQIANAQENEHI